MPFQGIKVSVLVVTYNQEKYIQKALEGLLIQRDCPSYEIILCDDHSLDNTLEIANRILSDLSNITILKNEKNLGITKNYQQAFARCKGEYIFILEGDDYWIDPWKIKKQSDFLDQHPMCVMCAHTFIAQQTDNCIFTFPENKSTTDYIYFDGKDLILDESIISNFSTCCYRSHILKKISPKTFETISYEWIINISVAEFGFLARINIPMSVYRQSPSGSWTQLSMKERLSGMHDIIVEYDRILEYRYSIYFTQKQQMLLQKLRDIEMPEKVSIKKVSIKSYLPPFAFLFLKWIIPPALIKWTRN